MTDSTSGAGSASDSAGKAAEAAAAADRAAVEAQSAAAAETPSVEAQMAAAAQAVGAAPTPSMTQVDATIAAATAPTSPVDISIDVSTLSQLSSIDVSAPTSLGGLGLPGTTTGVSYADIALGVTAQQPSTPATSTELGFSAIGKVDGLTQNKIDNDILDGISFSAGVAYNGLNTRTALEARMNPTQETLTGVASYSYTDPLAGPASINALGIETTVGLVGTNANSVKGNIGVAVDETTSLNFDALANFENLDLTGASFTGKVNHALSDRLNAELSGQLTTSNTDFTGATVTGKISGTTPGGLNGYGSVTGRYNAATDTWSTDFRVGAGGKF